MGFGFVRCFRCLAVLIWGAASPAFADQLLYASIEDKTDGRYSGVGWMAAPLGMGRTGPVLAFETGTSDSPRSSVMGGLRLSYGRALVTLLAGLEVEDGLHSTRSVDAWWDDSGWMATARAQTGATYDSWRAAVGHNSAGVFFGPELSSTGGATRSGLHATGVPFFGAQARISGGFSPEGSYAELSLWRNF